MVSDPEISLDIKVAPPGFFVSASTLYAVSHNPIGR